MYTHLHTCVPSALHVTCLLLCCMCTLCVGCRCVRVCVCPCQRDVLALLKDPAAGSKPTVSSPQAPAFPGGPRRRPTGKHPELAQQASCLLLKAPHPQRRDTKTPAPLDHPCLSWPAMANGRWNAGQWKARCREQTGGPGGVGGNQHKTVLCVRNMGSPALQMVGCRAVLWGAPHGQRWALSKPGEQRM